MKTRICGLAVALTALASAPAFSAEFAVGRASVQLPGDGWRVIPMTDRGIDYGGDVSGTIKSETKVFVKESVANGLEAVVLVRSSGSVVGRGAMAYNPNCKSDSNWYAKGNVGFNTHFYECLQVMRKYSAQAILKSVAPGTLEELQKQNASLPGSLYPILIHYASSNGTFLQVRAFMAPGFLGRAGPLSGAMPNGVEAQVVLWGIELMSSVRQSVNSISGAMVLPSVEFTK